MLSHASLLRSTRQAVGSSRSKPAIQVLRLAPYSDKPGQLTPTKEATEAGGVQPARSEEGQVIPAGITSGAPGEAVKLLDCLPNGLPFDSPMMNCPVLANNHTWVLDWDTLQGAGRWENPLMGWGASADYMQGTNVKFQSSEAAVAFCEKQGWPYFVQAPKSIKFKPKSYSDNYLYSDSKLRIHKTK